MTKLEDPMAWTGHDDKHLPNIVTRFPAIEAIERVAQVVAGLPVFIAGSAVAAVQYDQIADESYDDIDLFCSTGNVLVAVAQKMLSDGFVLEDRSERVWVRWLNYGFKTWHTNSLKLVLPAQGGDDRVIKVNLVYKLVDGHATTSLAQVIESFDFGLLAVGYDCSTDTWRDLRSFLFPGVPYQDGTLPLMPNKRSNWRQGFISKFNGLREVGRYMKYVDYGFDMSLVKDDLVTGYFEAARYLKDRDQVDKVVLGNIYESIAVHMDGNDYDLLRAAGAEIPFMDELDKIMETLE